MKKLFTLILFLITVNCYSQSIGNMPPYTFTNIDKSYLGLYDSTHTYNVSSHTYKWSLAQLKAYLTTSGFGTGTVTSVGSGYGLLGGAITTTGTLRVDSSKVATRYYVGATFTPLSRTLTINGTALDLSANRSWSVGTVTSVATGVGLTGGTITLTGTLKLDTTYYGTISKSGLIKYSDFITFNNKVTSLTGGTGISIGGTTTVPIVTNSLPDQTVVLTSGTGISATGTYPNFTITNTAPSTVTPSALTKTDDTNVTLTLGGTPLTALLQATSLTLGWTGTLADGRIASASTWNGKQNAISLTTTGSSGASTLVGATLNIPNYSIAGLSPLTTKGDLFTFSTVNTRLAVGANASILMADNTAPTGNKWTLSAYPTAVTQGDLLSASALNVVGRITIGTANQLLRVNAGGTLAEWFTPTYGSGTVTSVGQTFTGGLISVAGSPITTSGTLALTVAGTSGGVPYFSGTTTWASSALLAANSIMIGGGAGTAPSTTTTGTGVLTALGVNTGSAGAFVVNGGSLGTPSSGTLTNATGLPEGGLSLTNITTNNTSTSAHGFFPMLTSNSTYYVSNAGALTALTVGAANTYLTGNGITSAPTWGQVSLASGVTGNLPVTNLNSGTSASSSTFWRGDGTWSSNLGTPTIDLTNAINLPLTTGVTGILPIANGGTAKSSFVTYALVAGGTTTTGALQQLSNGSATGQILQYNGSSALASWSTPTYPSAAGTSGKVLISDGSNNVYSTSTFPTSAGATANKLLLSDGTNYVLSTPTFPNASASSGKFIRSDGTNWIASTPTLPTSAGTSGKVLQSDGTNYVESTPTYPSASGTVGQYLMSDGTNVVYTDNLFSSITSSSSAINTTETVLLSTGAMAANRLRAGTVLRITIIGVSTQTAANASTISVRIGTAGTTSDGLMQQFTTGVSSTTGTAIPFAITLYLTIRTVGASSTSIGTLSFVNNTTAASGLVAQAINTINGSATNFDNTVASNIISVTYKSAASTTTATFSQVVIEPVGK